LDWTKPDAEKKTPFSVIPDTEEEWPAELCFLALGFRGPEKTVAEQLGVEFDARTNYKADHGKYTTNVEGIFAAGDCRRGQSLAAWAINEGGGAARECDRYLMGKTDLPLPRRISLALSGSSTTRNTNLDGCLQTVYDKFI